MRTGFTEFGGHNVTDRCWPANLDMRRISEFFSLGDRSLVAQANEVLADYYNQYSRKIIPFAPEIKDDFSISDFPDGTILKMKETYESSHHRPFDPNYTWSHEQGLRTGVVIRNALVSFPDLEALNLLWLPAYRIDRGLITMSEWHHDRALSSTMIIDVFRQLRSVQKVSDGDNSQVPPSKPRLSILR